MKNPAILIFAEDEHLCNISAQWSADELLGYPALFFLKDVCPLLGLTTPGVVVHAKALAAKGLNPYTAMGVRKLWNHWYVRMKVFAPYYRTHFQSPIRTIKRGMDANALLAQKGVFLLSQVCRCIPFSSNQLRHQARKLPVEECGIFRKQETYLVQMEVFGPWLSRLWQEGFERNPAREAPQELDAKAKASHTS